MATNGMTLIASHTFSGTRPGPRLLITAGVHGDEFEPISAVRQLVAWFRDRAPIVASFCGRVTLVPVVNAAAFHNGTRTADDGLDLARVCPGRDDGTITERVAAAISRMIRETDYYIDLHTGGTQLAICPLAGYMLHANRDLRERQRRMAYAFGLPIVWGTTASLEGRTLSVARDAGVPAIYIEHGGAASCDRAGVDACVTGCLNVMAEIGCLAGPSPAGPVVHFVEDDRPNAGHLQIQHPSPTAGLFEPAVRLGDSIAAGEPIGTVYDLPGDSVHVITAHQSGLVLVLRSFPHVRAGDSLCVILECDEVDCSDDPSDAVTQKDENR